MKALGIIGYHHNGKTTLVTALVKALRDRGFTVSTIKDIHNQEYRADQAGTNTWKHAQAGAQSVFAQGLHDAALLFPEPLKLQDILKLQKTDYLIIEGMKDAAVPKIVCAESEEQLAELVDDTVIGISGIISNHSVSYKNLKVYCLSQDMDVLIQDVMAKSFTVLPHPDPECCSACGTDCYTLARDIVQAEGAGKIVCMTGKIKPASRWEGRKLPLCHLFSSS
jgi:molybdopterin-guanine dinucleotide biosynthesis protein B